MAMRRSRPLQSPSFRPLAVDGDERQPVAGWFEAVYDRYATIVYSLALRITGDALLAEETLIQVFARLWRAGGRVDHARRSLIAWLVIVTRAVALDLARQGAPEARVVSFPVARATERPGAAIGDDQLDDARIAVRAAIDALPVSQRQTLELAFFHGLTVAEIAKEMGATEAVAARRLTRGATLLGEYLATGWTRDRTDR